MMGAGHNGSWAINKTLRRGTDPEEQRVEAYRYWQSQPIGARLIAVSELSQQAYACAAGFKEVPANDQQDELALLGPVL
jgi:hypothetical protein